MSNRKIPDEAILLLTSKGFDDAFFKALIGSKNHEQAYLKVEDMYKSYYGKSRYSNFLSYKKIRNRRMKKS
jgi:hypothetical protein